MTSNWRGYFPINNTRNKERIIKSSSEFCAVSLNNITYLCSHLSEEILSYAVEVEDYEDYIIITFINPEVGFELHTLVDYECNFRDFEVHEASFNPMKLYDSKEFNDWMVLLELKSGDAAHCIDRLIRIFNKCKDLIQI